MYDMNRIEPAPIKGANLPANVRAALSDLSTFTAGSWDFSRLSGMERRFMRARMMEALLGRKVPPQRCGWMVLRSAFCDALDVPKHINAPERERRFRDAIRQHGYPMPGTVPPWRRAI